VLAGKNPRQLTAKARVASAAKAHTGRSFDFVDDILVNTPSARPAPFLRISLPVSLQKFSLQKFNLQKL
jgi:hypothetical protein